MTRKQVWQYWCDHCGKHNLSAASIAQHEKHCVKNPNRICRMCVANEQKQLPLQDLIECIDISRPGEGFERLRANAEFCPACILSALLLCGAHRPGFTLMNPQFFTLMGLPSSPFDFKAECKTWWQKVNERNW